MRTDLRLTMFEEKLKSISTEIDVLVCQITDSDKLIKDQKEGITHDEIIEQLREVQDFINS